MSGSNNKSIIFYNGFREKSYCGYCKKGKTSCSHGMWASRLSVQAYQDMIDRGWRRSGKYCYKASMDKTCCPLYTIRCEALNFELSKSQKKIIKKVTKFLKCGEYETNTFDNEQAEREPLMNFETHDIHNHDDKMQVTSTDTDQLYVEEPCSSVTGLQNSSTLVTDKEVKNTVLSVNLSCEPETTKENKKVKPGEGANPNLPKCKKKKLLRIEKKLAKNPNSVITTSVPQQKSLEDFISENDLASIDESKKLRVSLVQTGTEEFSQTFTAGASLFAKYQIAVHNDQPDDCDMSQYFEFLVNSPLQAEKANHSDHPGYGSFHQQYWLGDKLIAVGVIDILPKCISSVYLFYDPDYHHLVLGTYSSLREICLVRKLYSMSPDMKYYYMGFYIHTCAKMRYKAKFRPSYLLCPLRYTWHAVERCIQKLDNEKYSIFNESDDVQDDGDTLRIDNIPVLYCGTLMTYSKYKTINYKENQDELMTEYSMLVGPKLVRQLIYCFLD
ncbi:arginyl-tRNA--protein transferase 1 isoform X1 [Sipha flava]|uniref:Arginyl-tRNA--protein transferase 1 n=1 Tax=Sipha flava TaxID=143950 RepID=A0A8B8GIZ9_9HEMI|nr:arginyl-tRNA--protein transferase 1 isoform X1 [Sipha flava]